MAREVELAALGAIADLYQEWTVSSEQLHQEIGQAARQLFELTRQWECWLAEVSWWTPEDSRLPARPTSLAHSKVLAAADDWWGFGADRLHEQLIAALTTQGHRVAELSTTGADGELVQLAHTLFGLRGHH